MSEWRPVPGSEPLPDRERPVGHVLSGFAARLDPCVNWFKLLAATRGRILWIFPIVLLGAYLGALSQYNPIGDFQVRRSERRANASLLAEARRLNLDYEKVLADPKAYVGKPVAWCISTTAANSSFVAGRPAWPVALNGSFDDYRTNTGSASYCLDVLAVITGFEHGLIQLRPVEKF